MRIRPFVLQACVALFPFLCHAAVSPEKLKDAQLLLASEMARLRIPGLSVALGADFQVAWSKGFGWADVENHVPVTPASVFRLASVSKPVTAVAVMQLVESGKLDLDAPIQAYVPSFPQKPWPVTARLLLGHLGGIRNYLSDAETYSTRHYTDLTEPLKLFAEDALLFEPGSRYSYSTYGYSLLGAAVESASGMKFLDYLREHVFVPAGAAAMRDDTVYDLVPHRVRGYRMTPSGELQNCPLADTSNKIPGGGMLGTPSDVVRFALAAARGTLLKPASAAEMFTSLKMLDGKTTHYGLGWQIYERGEHRWVGHAGGQAGVSTMLLLLPEEGYAVALAANLEGLNLATLAGRLADLLAPPFPQKKSPAKVDPDLSLR